MARTKIWAHRGASAYAPENTLEAFRKAVTLRADGVELDVQLSKDGEVVVVHDERLERVSNGTGYVKDHTLQELKRMNFGDLDSIDFTQIPTLQEVYQLLSPTDLLVNVELKTGIFPYEGIEEKVLRIAEDYGMEQRVFYSSFNHESLINIRNLDSSAKTGLLYSDGWYHLFDYAKNTIGVYALLPAFFLLQKEGYVEAAHEAGFAVYPWTANESADIRRCISEGVDGFATNKPDLARVLMSDML